MGGKASKQDFRAAVLDLVTSKQSVTALDNSFWDRFWSDPTLTPQDYFTLITFQDIRDLRDKASGNLTALCFKVVEKISACAATACTGDKEQVIVLNCVQLLTRLLPFLFEAPDWRLLFWSPASFLETQDGEQPQALAQVLLNSLTDLLFCPDFTVVPKSKLGPENPDDLASLDSCEYIWEAGIGCTHSPGSTKLIDNHRTAILKLLITCFSEALYLTPGEVSGANRWLSHFTSPENRHVLPLLTSLINVVCSYDPVGYGVPYYYAMVADPRGELVETSTQLLAILLDYTSPSDLVRQQQTGGSAPSVGAGQVGGAGMGNLFCSFISRLHQTEDLELITKGLTNLLMNPLRYTYLPHSIKKIYFTQEIYIIFWKLFELNQKFLMHMLCSPTLFDMLVPLLQQLLETRTNPALVGMLHVGVFILLVLSGERNFGVRINKPFLHKIYMPDIPKCTGASHADLMFLVFHKIITSGLPRLQPLYDCLLTVMVNVSPYLKTLSMVTCSRLMHLMESFSTPWFLFAKPTNHYLVFYMLEIFNNIIQYQFDGNINLVYSLVRSKAMFYQLANLPEDSYQVTRPQRKVGDNESTLPQVPLEGEEQATEAPPPQSPESGEGHVADIAPPALIQTVQVEVEPQSDTEEIEKIDREPAEPPLSQPPPPSHISPATPSQASPLTQAPPPIVPTHQEPEKSKPGKKKTGKGKPATAKDLLPLHKEVARNNQQLIEPTTPDFKPTTEWVRGWKQKLPLNTVLRVLQILVPQVEKLCTENDVKSEREVLEYLKNGTLVGLLPVPHPILIRKYQTSDSTELWFHTYIWGVVYVRNFDPPIWYDTTIQLFQVHKTDITQATN
ncbi:protein HID1-like [Halichondria panicea]|uniref:protein HID1-like n=1 Tax=Halichondria panicea TaxID=6063 RepID=UPI00312B5027